MANKVIEQSHSGLLQLIEETLTDGSHVYNVKVGTTTLACADRTHANILYTMIDSPDAVVDIEI